jgi:dTDP-4-amino-4,6-dideoxygalactose transaminase
MKIPFGDLRVQYDTIKFEIDEAIKNVISESAFIGGRYVKQFEEDFKAYLNIKHCIGCANGTDSIEILLRAHDIKPGDEVIVPAHSWFSTSEAVSAVGAIPIFVDVLPNIYTINTDLIEVKISSKTKAIIPVHLYGLAAEMDRIMDIAKKYNLVVIEDCAQAHGALYKGKMIGTIGHSASFSFYPGKNLGAYGDAGGMVTNDNEVAEKARMISQHGQKGKHNHIIEGRNSRLDGIHAAILSVKLKHLDKWNAMRVTNANLYLKLLANNSNLTLPLIPDNFKHVFHLFVVQVENRDQLIEHLNSKNIETAIHYPSALPLLPAYNNYNYTKEDFPVAALQADRILSLPMFPELSNENIESVCETLLNFYVD